MSRKRLLFICSELPYPVIKGIRIRQSTQIEALSREFDISVAVTHSPVKSGIYEVFGGAVQVEGWPSRPKPPPPGPVTRLLSFADYYVTPPSHRECHHARFIDRIRNGYFEMLWVSRLKSAWTLGDTGSIPCVLDLDEIESRTRDRRVKLSGRQSLLQGLVHWSDIRALARVEREVSSRYDIVTLSAKQDLNWLPYSHIRYLPNCPPATASSSRGKRIRDESLHILFIGTLEYDPNLHGIKWFLTRIWPRLLYRMPSVQLHIVGEGGERHEHLATAPGVSVYGLVDDPSPLWGKCDLTIVPIFASGGTRIKILEAWQRGVPVVTTCAGVDGLGATDGIHAIVADTEEAFVQGCEAVLTSESLRDSLVAAGATLINAEYSRSKVEELTLRIASEALFKTPHR